MCLASAWLEAAATTKPAAAMCTSASSTGSGSTLRPKKASAAGNAAMPARLGARRALQRGLGHLTSTLTFSLNV